ncbi:hypothetical protein FKM82_020987, partial [Ascaphus truei]
AESNHLDHPDLEIYQKDKNVVPSGPGDCIVKETTDSKSLDCLKPNVKVKNAFCWATFSKPITTPLTIKSSSNSFQQFRKAAMAKEERERALKAQQLKKRQKGEALGDISSGQLDGDTNDTTAAAQIVHGTTKDEQLHEPTQDSQGCTEGDRNLARKKEQERRRREAVSDPH